MKEKLEAVKINLTTTLLGAAVVLVVVGQSLLDYSAGKDISITQIITGITAGLGLVFARNAWTSSEDSGVSTNGNGTKD